MFNHLDYTFVYGGIKMSNQKLTKAILEFLNDYQEENGDVSSGEIVGSLEWAKLATYTYARKINEKSISTNS